LLESSLTGKKSFKQPGKRDALCTFVFNSTREWMVTLTDSTAAAGASMMLKPYGPAAAGDDSDGGASTA